MAVPFPKQGAALLALLAISAGLGGAILAVDRVLWNYGRSHAYGLVAFVVVDVLLIGLLFARPRSMLLGTAVWAVVQFIILLGNVVVGAQLGVEAFTQEEFTQYLLGLSQARLMTESSFYVLSPYAYDILLILQPLTAGLAVLGFRRVSRHPPAHPR
jgi:hypothetical protein